MASSDNHVRAAFFEMRADDVSHMHQLRRAYKIQKAWTFTTPNRNQAEDAK
jgi:hypothetical protein